MGCFESKENERPDPTAVRGCTDVLWLIIYVLFWILMVGLSKINFIILFLRRSICSIKIKYHAFFSIEFI